MELNLDTPEDEPDCSGVYGLWLHVLYLSVLEIQNRRFSAGAAKDFIFDPGNIFFDFVADEMGFDPDGLRERIRKSMDYPGRRAQHRRCGAIRTRDDC